MVQYDIQPSCAPSQLQSISILHLPTRVIVVMCSVHERSVLGRWGIQGFGPLGAPARHLKARRQTRDVHVTRDGLLCSLGY